MCVGLYNKGWKITDIMPINSTGVKTHRDHFVFDFDLLELRKRIENFRNLSLTDLEVARTYNLNDTRDWKLSQRRHFVAADSKWEQHFTQCLYRPFDLRNYYHHEDVVELPRHEVMRHMLAGENFGLICSRQQSQQGGWSLIGLTTGIVECCAISNKTKETNYFFLCIFIPKLKLRNN